MKRIGNLYKRICSLDNLLLADKKASRGKSKQLGVKFHRLNAFNNLLNLQSQLQTKTYQVSSYKRFVIREPKERIIHVLPYIDRIVQHAIMNVVGSILFKCLTTNTYSCIPKRGVHLASYKLRHVLRGGCKATRS